MLKLVFISAALGIYFIHNRLLCVGAEIQSELMTLCRIHKHPLIWIDWYHWKTNAATKYCSYINISTIWSRWMHEWTEKLMLLQKISNPVLVHPHQHLVLQEKDWYWAMCFKNDMNSNIEETSLVCQLAPTNICFSLPPQPPSTIFYKWWTFMQNGTTWSRPCAWSLWQMQQKQQFIYEKASDIYWLFSSRSRNENLNTILWF